MIAQGYTPLRGDDWERREPAALGFDPAALDDTVAFAERHETPSPREMTRHWLGADRGEPFPEPIGPIKDRGGPNGLILRHGYLVAEWGDTRRVDMTFSVAKSYLSTMAGLALDRGLIHDLREPAGRYVDTGHFDGPRHSQITWRHLLQQTSEWAGELWGKPYWADSQGGQTADTPLGEPGSVYAYNDVRVNLLALSLLHVWRKPLPRVLKDEVMDPIGASTTWRWHGYDNAWVTLDGLRMQSVSGGGHWGGGVWASSRDHARFGLLFLRRGRWGERRIISERWIDGATTPCEVKPDYGYMWWLNTGGALVPDAPRRSFAALGARGNVIWIDPEHDLVAVVRWTDPDRRGELLRRVTAALRA